MKLDYLAEGSADCPLIRLFSFTPREAEQLRSEIARLANRSAKRVGLNSLTWIESIGGCRLALCTNPWDQGIIQSGEPAEFECRFSPQTWDNVAGLVEPFAGGAAGFQWLACVPGVASLLLSPSGKW